MKMGKKPLVASLNFSLISMAVPALFFVACQQRRQIQGPMHHFATVGGTSASTNNYDSLNEQYDSLAARYNAAQVQNDELKTINTRLDSALTNRNNELTNLRKTIKETETKKLVQVENKNTTLKEELKQEIVVNNSLLELVSNFRIWPLHVSPAGRRIRTTRRAKKINELRISFDIDRNLIAGKGDKALYLVITSPKGKLTPVTDYRSGTIKNFNGDDVDYSLEKDVVMIENQALKNVQLTCRLGEITERGIYKFSIYNNGYIIGDQSVDLQ